MAITALIIDGLNLIRRIDAALRDGPAAAGGTSVVDSCTQSLKRALKECRPTHAVCVFEGTGDSFRKELFEGYKKGRAPMPQDLETSLPAIKESFREAGVGSFEREGTEADDVIATLACKLQANKAGVIILSTDKVFLQLLSGLISVRDHFHKRFLDEAYVREKFEVNPYQLGDLLALAGDPTNSIPGIPGIGMKTAARLLREFQTLENILSHAPAMGTKLGQSLTKNESSAVLYQQLLRLKTDLDLGINLQEFRCSS